MRGSCARASRKVAPRCGSGLAERGNISYQAPKRARSRSTQTRCGSDTVARERSAYAAITAALVVAVGLLLARAGGAVVAAAQVLAVFVLLTAMFTKDATFGLLPGPAALREMATFVADAGEQINTGIAPLPATPEILFLITAAFGFLVLANTVAAMVAGTALGVFGVLGYIGGWFGPDTVTAVQQWINDLTGGVFSTNVADEIIVPTVTDILTVARGEVVSVGFLLSL